MFKNFQIMDLKDFKKVDFITISNRFFTLSFVQVNGLSVVKVTPKILPVRFVPEVFVDFYFKDFTSALAFISRYKKHHSYAFWMSKHEFIFTYHFWLNFSSSLSSSNKRWLNVLNGFVYDR